MANIASLEVTGLKETMARLTKLGVDVQPVTERGIFRWGETVMGDAKENFVPVDKGTLRNSGFVMTDQLRDVPAGATPSPEAMAAARNTRNEVRGVLGFGGAAASYALKVHENPRSGKTGGVSPRGARYRSWATRGQWKYLQTPVQNRAAQLDVTVAQELEKEIARISGAR